MTVAALAGAAMAQDAAPHAEPAAASTMQAMVVSEMGVPGVMKLQTVPRPVPGDDDILLRVHAAGVNPVDYKIRSGARSQWARPPYIPGFDASGVVESVGKNVTRFKPGDEIFTYVSLQRGGAYAQYMLTNESECARKPAKLTFDQAAAVPLAALTAWQALLDHGKLEAGQTVLIHGGAGGVGHFAVQIAKAKGARVVATGSAESQAIMKDLGADQTIDYRAAKFEDVVKDVDLVLDTVGGETLDRSWSVLKKGGRLVSIVQTPDEAKAAAAGATGVRMLVKPDAEDLGQIGELIDAGQIKVVVTMILPLADAPKAHEQIATGHTKGKIVLKVADAQPATPAQ